MWGAGNKWNACDLLKTPRHSRPPDQSPDHCCLHPIYKHSALTLSLPCPLIWSCVSSVQCKSCYSCCCRPLANIAALPRAWLRPRQSFHDRHTPTALPPRAAGSSSLATGPKGSQPCSPALHRGRLCQATRRLSWTSCRCLVLSPARTRSRAGEPSRCIIPQLEECMYLSSNHILQVAHPDINRLRLTKLGAMLLSNLTTSSAITSGSTSWRPPTTTSSSSEHAWPISMMLVFRATRSACSSLSGLP